MVNFYQRNVLRGTPNDIWLEETTATMTDDIVTPVATPDHVSIVPLQRVRPYVASGGGITLTGWEYPVENSYALAGAFGAFVDRRYGTSILSGTIDCPGTGVDCMDGLIRAAGGTSFADDFARVGASIFGLLPLNGTPEGYGYPSKVTGAYTLAPIDVAAYAANRKATATRARPGLRGGKPHLPDRRHRARPQRLHAHRRRRAGGHVDHARDPLGDPLTRSALVVLASAVLGCAQATPAPADPPAAGVQPAAATELSGRLSRKGPSETSTWAVTDAAGKVWEIVEVTPELDARFRRIQNAQVTLRVERKGRVLFDQVRVLDVVRPAP